MSEENNALHTPAVIHTLERRQRAMRRDAIRPTKAERIERQVIEILADFPLTAATDGGTVISVALPKAVQFLIAYVGAGGCLTWAPDCLLDYDVAHAVARRICELTDARYLAAESWRQPL